MYDSLCALPKPPVEAIVGRAFLLKSMNRADLAFASLKAFRESYWKHPGFVLAFTEMGFASSREREASEGLGHLQLLLAEEKADGVIQAVTIDEFIRMTREFYENDDEVHRKMIAGKMPGSMPTGLRGKLPTKDGGIEVRNFLGHSMTPS